VLAMLDEKSKGNEIVVDTLPTPSRGQVVDIMEALKRSMERVRPRRSRLWRSRLRIKKIS
jgi:non-homologous end joining protein Ku